jgi:hypothetical protein
LRLEGFPPEIVIRIAQYLRPRVALALSGTSRRMFDVLSRDIVYPLRLGARIQWVNSLSAFQAALADVMAAPVAQRRRLYPQLQNRHFFLHPQLRDAARIVLQCHKDPPATTSYGSTPPPVDAWPGILDAAPRAARGEVLAMMADAIPIGGDDDEGGAYEQAIEFAIAGVRGSAGPEGGLPLDHARVLAQLAYRLVHDAARWEPARHGQCWDALFSLACSVPLHAQASILVNLAESVHLEDTGAEQHDATAPPPRWNHFISYVRSRFAPAEVARILGVLSTSSSEEEENAARDRSIRNALLPAALALPEQWRATLLAQIIWGHPRDSEATMMLWDAAFAACATIPAQYAVRLFHDLAGAIDSLPPDRRDASWDALCQRICQSGDLHLMLDALLALASVSCGGAHSLSRRAMLVSIGERLTPPARAALLAEMTVRRGITPDLWRAQVAAVANLPLDVRREPAALLADILFRYQTDEGIFVAPSAEVLPDPGILAAARLPCTAAEARNKLSDILALLPLGDRGAVLLSLAQVQSEELLVPWDAAAVCWLLDEVLKLAPLHHHGIEALTTIARTAAQRCATEAQAHAIIPPLRRAVRVLPPEARANAFLFLGSLIQRRVPNQDIKRSWTKELVELPATDLNVIRSHKRKGAPE